MQLSDWWWPAREKEEREVCVVISGRVSQSINQSNKIGGDLRQKSNTVSKQTDKADPSESTR